MALSIDEITWWKTGAHFQNFKTLSTSFAFVMFSFQFRNAKEMNFISVVVCRRNISPTSGGIKRNGREIPRDASLITVTPSACQRDRRR